MTEESKYPPRNWSKYGEYQLLLYMTQWILIVHLPEFNKKGSKCTYVACITTKETGPKVCLTFAFKCTTILLLASSNWSLSSLVLLSRELAAFKEIVIWFPNTRLGSCLHIPSTGESKIKRKRFQLVSYTFGVFGTTAAVWKSNKVAARKSAVRIVVVGIQFFFFFLKSHTTIFWPPPQEVRFGPKK